MSELNWSLFSMQLQWMSTDDIHCVLIFFLIIWKRPNENSIYSLSFYFNYVSIYLDLPSHRAQVQVKSRVIVVKV